MFTQKFYGRVFIICLMGWGLFACSSGVKPTEMDGTITISGDVNPDRTGRPSPIIVRMYQLRNSGVFTSADFFKIYESESSILSGDLISREEYDLLPGESRSITPLIDPQTRYIGVIAAFRDIEQSSWRAISVLPEEKFYDFSSPVVNILLKKKSISINIK